jgi:hypothetical protein
LADTDGDGTPDYLDTDSDNDGYTDCEEGNTKGEIAGNCPVTSVEGNGMTGWAGGANNYSDVNGNVDNPKDTDQMQNETGNTDEMGWREFLCGKNVTSLTTLNWKLISIPCDTGSNSIDTLFGGTSGLGTYGTNWVMYRQSALVSGGSNDDNYETNSGKPNTNKTRLASSDTVVPGASYWIITDADHTITIDKGITGLSPTSTTPANNLNGVNDPDFTETYLHNLPDNNMNTAGNIKKVMIGNPFPYAFELENLYFSHNAAGGNDYYPMGSNQNDTYINATVYKHDDPRTGPVDGYVAINPGTPGFTTGGIKAMEGFFIKLPEVAGDSTLNYFAHPLMMKNGNGN